MGHPDFQDYAQWLGEPLASVDQVVTAASGLQLGGWDVGNWRSLLFLMHTSGADIRLISTFRQADTVLPTYPLMMELDNNARAAFTIPVVAPYLEEVDLGPQAVNTTVRLHIIPTNLPAPASIPDSGWGSGILGSDAADTIGIGGTATYGIAPHIGEAWVAIRTQGGNWEVSMPITDYAGTTIGYALFPRTIAGEFETMVALPPAPVKIRAVNNTGAANDWGYTVVPIYTH